MSCALHIFSCHADFLFYANVHPHHANVVVHADRIFPRTRVSPASLFGDGRCVMPPRHDNTRMVSEVEFRPPYDRFAGVSLRSGSCCHSVPTLHKHCTKLFRAVCRENANAFDSSVHGCRKHDIAQCNIRNAHLHHVLRVIVLTVEPISAREFEPVVVQR